MMPELGKYADTVLAAYGVSILLLLALIVFSIQRGRKVRAEMDRVEQRASRNG
ncbi:MAG: heme exporter protein CcmD [Ruegeria sp.]